MNSKVVFVSEHTTVSVMHQRAYFCLRWLHVIRQALAVAANKGSDRLLLGARKAQWRLTTGELCILPRMLEDVGLMKSHRQAVIFNEGDYISILNATVFLSRGFESKVFSETDPAIAWLKENSRCDRIRTQEPK